MYLCQSRQVPSLKKRSILTARQQHRHRTQTSIGDIFESLSVSIVSTSHLKENGEDTFEFKELIQLNSDPCIKHLNTL